MKSLTTKTDATVLGLFRAVFGFFMALECIYFLKIDFVKNALILPKVHFSYPFFGWLKAGPEELMDLLVFLLLCSAVLIMIGKYLRISSLFFSIGFLYLLLLDKGHYNNHTYMFSLVAFLLSFTNADKRFSLAKAADSAVPLWQYQILRAMVFIVYFYGGLAKLNADWLSCGEPMRSYLFSISPDLADSTFAVNFFKIGGLGFDLFIGFFLFYRPTRMIALFFVAFFNFSNAYIFDDIGIFPFIMFFSTIIFFEDGDWVVTKLRSLLGLKNIRAKKEQDVALAKLPVILIVFFVFQLLFPFRYLLLPHDKDWTGIGQRFSWRMKIQTRPVSQYEVRVVNTENGTEAPVQVNTFINTMQMRVMSQDPVMLWQFGQFLKEEAARKGIPQAEVHAAIRVSMNGTREQYIVDPDLDIAAQDFDPLAYNEWIPERMGDCSEEGTE